MHIYIIYRSYGSISMLTDAGAADVFFEEPAAQSKALALLSQKQGQEWAVSEGKVHRAHSTCTRVQKAFA